MDHILKNQIILIFNAGRGICVWTAALPLLQWYLAHTHIYVFVSIT